MARSELALQMDLPVPWSCLFAAIPGTEWGRLSAMDVKHTAGRSADVRVSRISGAGSSLHCMNQERKAEIERLIDETEEMKRQVNLQLNEDHPKYKDADAWEQALTSLTDKISDLLTEERDALEAEAWTEAKETKEHAALTEAVIYLEHALNHGNAALDSIEEGDFEQARTELEDLIHQLKKSLDT